MLIIPLQHLYGNSLMINLNARQDWKDSMFESHGSSGVSIHFFTVLPVLTLISSIVVQSVKISINANQGMCMLTSATSRSWTISP